MKKNCLNCTVEFESPDKRRKFCSKSCSARFNNRGKQKNPPKPRNCRKCGVVFFYTNGHSRGVSCKSCLQPTGNKSPLSKGDCLGSGSSRYRAVREHCARVHKCLKTKPCAKCGYDKHVELCHIRSIASFPNSALLVEINAETNVVQLCPNCHWELDNFGAPDQI